MNYIIFLLFKYIIKNIFLNFTLDFVGGGELFTHLYKTERFSLEQVRLYIAETVMALETLHRLRVVYRDIKLENILIDAGGHIVITDFGLSKELKSTRDRAISFCGTIEYMAPEIVRSRDGHTLSADWWSVGVLAYELLTGASPFTVDGEHNTQHEISERILNIDPPSTPELNGDIKDFVLGLLVKDPQSRLGKIYLKLYKHIRFNLYIYI